VLTGIFAVLVVANAEAGESTRQHNAAVIAEAAERIVEVKMGAVADFPSLVESLLPRKGSERPFVVVVFIIESFWLIAASAGMGGAWGA
jgi:ABC-type thiamin/hydroxymethylpyrimidine transport system permease subunit